jgi:hypothetical protein
MSSRLLEHAGRQPLRFPPRACHEKCGGIFRDKLSRYGLAAAEAVPIGIVPLTAPAFPALSRLQGTYALARSGGGVRGYRRSLGRSGPSRLSGRGRLRRPSPLRIEGPPLHVGRYAMGEHSGKKGLTRRPSAGTIMPMMRQEGGLW